MSEWVKEDQLPYYQLAELSNNIEMLARLTNTKNVEQSRIGITTQYKKLQEIIKPILLDGTLESEVPKSDLYSTGFKYIHMESGLEFDSLGDIPSTLRDDDLSTLANRKLISKEKKWKRKIAKTTWLW